MANAGNTIEPTPPHCDNAAGTSASRCRARGRSANQPLSTLPFQASTPDGHDDRNHQRKDLRTPYRPRNFLNRRIPPPQLRTPPDCPGRLHMRQRHCLHVRTAEMPAQPRQGPNTPGKPRHAHATPPDMHLANSPGAAAPSLLARAHMKTDSCFTSLPQQSRHLAPRAEQQQPYAR